MTPAHKANPCQPDGEEGEGGGFGDGNGNGVGGWSEETGERAWGIIVTTRIPLSKPPQAAEVETSRRKRNFNELEGVV